jgi:hypothetical protein
LAKWGGKRSGMGVAAIYVMYDGLAFSRINSR